MALPACFQLPRGGGAKKFSTDCKGCGSTPKCFKTSGRGSNTRRRRIASPGLHQSLSSLTSLCSMGVLRTPEGKTRLGSADRTCPKPPPLGGWGCLQRSRELTSRAGCPGACPPHPGPAQLKASLPTLRTTLAVPRRAAPGYSQAAASGSDCLGSKRPTPSPAPRRASPLATSRPLRSKGPMSGAGLAAAHWPALIAAAEQRQVRSASLLGHGAPGRAR